jgi:HlyD family secretion protein
MEARVDIGEIDVVLIQLGQKARLEVEAFRDRKFSGVVTEIANAAKGPASSAQSSMSSSQQQEATKFEVKILVNEKEPFRPGMSVTAEIETRSRSNVLAVPIMAVTTRTSKDAKKEEVKAEGKGENSALPLRGPKKDAAPKPDEVVFLVAGDLAKLAKVKTGISDDSHIEITEGLSEGQQIIAGGYAAVSRQLEDGKKIKKEEPKKKSNDKKN